jgi:hypothetical protein
MAEMLLALRLAAGGLWQEERQNSRAEERQNAACLLLLYRSAELLL